MTTARSCCTTRALARWAIVAAKDTNGVIKFEWEGWTFAGPWSATGTLKGDSLTVQFNEMMHHTDFEDALYVLPGRAP